MLPDKKICVSMSGGVDSSIAAYMLLQQNNNIFGIYINTSDPHVSPGTFCSSSEDMSFVSQVCDILNIPYYSIDLHNEYCKNVIHPMLHDIQAGITPNPDVTCNEKIKFSLLLKKAQDMGADMLATGHYARIDSENKQLLKGTDINKDQSYFLYRLKPEILQKIIFPIGHMKKQDVRILAHQLNFPNASRKDSMGICLLNHSRKHFRDFLEDKIEENVGPIINEAGTTIGTHRGLHLFTIGQRKGINIGGAHTPYFVYHKDISNNTLYVTQDKQNLLSRFSCIEAANLSWLKKPHNLTQSYHARIRHLGILYEINILTLTDDRLICRSKEYMDMVTPGQAIVIYEGEICLGGGVIIHAH